MLGAVTCIGILGVAPKSSASDSLLVFFACVFSKSDDGPVYPDAR